MKSRKKLREVVSRTAGGLLAAAVVVSGLGVSASAHAATATLLELKAAVVSDGNLPFDDLDDGPHNGIVRTNDSVKYRFDLKYGELGEVRFVSTLPVGAEWDVSAAAATVCNGVGGGTLTDNNRTLTCNRTAVALQESFDLTAWVYSMKNDSTIEASITDGSVTTALPEVKVAARPATELVTYIGGENFKNNVTHNSVRGDGLLGFEYRHNVSLGATIVGDNVNLAGHEALGDTFTFSLKVPTDAEVTAISKAQGGGTVSFVQNNPGDDVLVTVTGARTDFKDMVKVNGYPDLFRAVAQYSITVWVPYNDTLPVGQATQIQSQVTGFDPDSVSGASNFAGGYAPGQDPSYTCPAGGQLTGFQLACFRYTVDRTNEYLVAGTMVGAVYSGNPITMLFGDGHGYTDGSENIVPGQSFIANVGLYNGGTALSDATGAAGCATWDNTYLGLTDPARPMLRNSTNSAAFINGQGSVMAASDATIEYSAAPYANDSARRAANCGKAGDGASGWVTDPDALPGGKESITSVRFLSNRDLAKGRAIGLQIPLKRTTNAASLGLPVDAGVPWFWQYQTNETPLVKSTFWSSVGTSWPGTAYPSGGYVQAVPSLVRATVDWSDAAVEPGNVSTVTVHPRVIGPVGEGIDTKAKNVQVAVTLGNTCSYPILATLDVSGVPYTYTPGDAGPDGTLCTADDGAPGKVVFNLGDIDAPGGQAGGTFHATVGGHETLLDVLQFQVAQSVYTPSNTHHIVTAIISADTDTSQESWEGDSKQNASAVLTDRTSTADLVVTGVAMFRGGKTSSTKVPGEVAPDETFLYTVNWGNGSTIPAGPGTFVDLLPYDGDARGTDGLSAAGFSVVDVEGETADPATMGTVSIQYSTDPSASIAAALALPGNETGDTGINWQSGAVPENTKAIRIVTSDNIMPGFSGSATIKVKAPELTRGGTLVNNFVGRTQPIAGDPTTVRSINAYSNLALSSSAGLIGGTVYRDANFDNSVSTGDSTWPAGTGLVEAVEGGVVRATTAINADGSYLFDPIAPGDYVIRVKDSATSGWTKIASPTAVASATITSGLLLRDINVLYQEDLEAAALVDDSAEVSQAGDIVIDVTENDTLRLPANASGATPLDGVRLTAGGEPTFGSVELVAPTSPATQSSIRYTAATDWPTQFADVTQYEDTFDYEWVDVLGAPQTATVTVTVYQKALAADDTVTIGSAGGSVEVLANDLGDDISIIGTPTSSGDLTATVNGDRVQVASTHVWAAGETSYSTSVSYEIEDSQGNTSTANIAVTVQRAPVVTGTTTALLPLNGAATFDPELLNPTSVVASDIVVTSQPVEGIVSIGTDGQITFDADGIPAGSYSFVVRFTDDLGQQVTQTYTVRVQAPPVAQGGSALIGVGQSHTFAAQPVTTGTISGATVSTAPSQGSASVAIDGTVVFDSTGASAGTYTFTVEFTDDLGQTGTADFSVVVQDAPVVTGKTSLTIGEGQKADFGSVVETTGKIESADVTKQPSHGSVSVDASGKVVFDADGVAPGTYTFEVTFVDDAGLTTIVTFTVIVQKAPTAKGANTIIPEGGHFTFTEQVETSGSITDKKITTPPSAGAFDLDTMDYAAGKAAPGKYTFVITYTDNVGQKVTATYEVVVQEAPKGKGFAVTLKSDTDRATFDPIGDTTGTKLRALTEADLVQPGHGKIALKKGLVVYTPEAGFFGTTTFQVTVTDNLGQSVVLTYTVKIVKDSDGPEGIETPLSEGPGGLAVTGASGISWSAGLVLLLAGAAALLVTRRKRSARN